ncbi:hypothetical protein C8J56DRAFT_305597 [Mycena floridula]|nr:hypothetical protein C8J56DRAFT_305597 [Mycena floridula]
MDFLHRRPQPPPLGISSRDLRPSTRKTLIRRVSSIFSRKKPSPIQTVKRETRGSTSSSSVSLDDIRRPSDLGPAASISSLPQSPFEEIHDSDAALPSRVRTQSTPNFHSFSFSVEAEKPLPPISVPPLTRNNPVLKLPLEVLVNILNFLPRRAIVPLAIVNGQFKAAVRLVIYGFLDLRDVHSRQYDPLIIFLASRRDLTNLTHTFLCPAWPPSFPLDYDGGSPRISLLTTATATLTNVLQNMHQLTSLTLPAFDLALLRHHTAFGLQRITLLNQSMSDEELIEFFTWLDGQTNVTSVKFPNLKEIPEDKKSIDSGDTHASRHTHSLCTTGFNFLSPSPAGSPAATPQSKSFPTIPLPAAASYPFNSATLLPSLTTLHATPSLTSLLANHRPLRHVTLNISTTLLQKLRPAALMYALKTVSTLRLRFSENVDRRTVEKVLGAAGAALGGAHREDSSAAIESTEPPVLELLEIEVPMSGPKTDDVLYKILGTVLPRFCLRTLLLYLSYPAEESTEFIQETFRIPNVDVKLSAKDEERIHSWLKHCPTLERVLLLSGAEWRVESRE